MVHRIIIAIILYSAVFEDSVFVVLRRLAWNSSLTYEALQLLDQFIEPWYVEMLQ